jgi:scyllo-inositol 2-dehydrogenase (NADP+)
VYDPMPERSAAVAGELRVPAHSAFEALLAEPGIELVVIASPNCFHALQARQALAAGKHVVCEKPFGLTTADVDSMIAAARASGRVLQPFQQRRYEPDFMKVKEVCESGLLGAIQFVRICWHSFRRRWDWQTMRSCGGGALNNNGPHPIDHALLLFGDGEPEVWAETRRCLCSGDAEDHLKVILSAPGHATIDIELSDVYAYGQDRWLVCGTAGGLRGSASGLEWKWVDWSTMPARPVDPNPTRDRSYNSEQVAWHTGSWQPERQADIGGGGAPAERPGLDLYADLRRTIREGKPQTITPESVRCRVAVLERVRALTGIPAWTAMTTRKEPDPWTSPGN